MRYYHQQKSNHVLSLAMIAAILVAGFYAYDYVSTSQVRAADSAVAPEESSSLVTPLSTEQTALLSKIEGFLNKM